LYNFDSKTIIYLDFINSMFSFTFDPLAAIFGISGIVGFFSSFLLLRELRVSIQNLKRN